MVFSRMIMAASMAVSWASAARAESGPLTGEVDMLLCLAADVSESVKPPEYDLQRKGHASAVEDPEIVALIGKGLHGRIAVAYVEWARQDQQFLGADWHIIDGHTTASAFAEKIRHSPKPPWLTAPVRNTSTGEAIQYCLKQFDAAPVKAIRKVIDISSDGTNNIGVEVTDVRDEAVRRGIVINVLAIEDTADAAHHPTHTRPEGGLVNYFKAKVAGGSGAFVEWAESYDTFGETMKRKFLLELAALE